MLLDTVLATVVRRRSRRAASRHLTLVAPVKAKGPPGVGSALSILYVGPWDGTCLQRARALADLGHSVHHLRSGIPRPTDPVYPFLRVAHRIKRHPDIYFANSRLLRLTRTARFDVVWIDKGLPLRMRTLHRMRERMPNARFVHYSPDDQFNPLNQSRRWRASIPFYDLHVTTKSYNVSELRALGARDVLFIDNAYDPAVHRPLALTPTERMQFEAAVGFVGSFEGDRAEMVYRLAEAGVPVTVRGPGWKRFKKSHPLLTIRDEYLDRDDYARAVNATRINLGFLCKANRDRQTTRSAEIPAMGAFLLAERTSEHRRMYEEGREAEFFDSFDQLLAKCRYYLSHESERRRVAVAGYRRCVLSGYSNQGRLATVLDHLRQAPPAIHPQPASIPAQIRTLAPIRSLSY